MRPPFADRRDAGRALGEALAGSVPGDVVVLGLPRGGVIVGAEVAALLGAPLQVLVVRKIGLPGQPELAMGAVAELGGRLETVRTVEVLARAGVEPEVFDRARDREVAELRRRAAVAAARGAGCGRVTVAVPVGSPRACARVREEADDVVCLWSPPDFRAVQQGYADFAPTSDDEVRAVLAEASSPPA